MIGKIVMVNKLIVSLAFSLLLSLGLKAQVVVGSFYLSVMDTEYKVIVDDMAKRFENKPISDEFRDKRIYVQVDLEEPDLVAFVELKPKSAMKNIEKVLKNFDKGIAYSQKTNQFRKKIDDDEVDIYLNKKDSLTKVSIYGYESGQDYDIFIEQGPDGNLFLSYIGGMVRSEGDDGLMAKGWRMTFSSKEEITQLYDLVCKANTIIVNNRLENQ